MTGNQSLDHQIEATAADQSVLAPASRDPRLILIVADSLWEGERLRQRYGLSRAQAEVVTDAQGLRGHYHAHVIMPSCYDRADEVARRMVWQELAITAARVAMVPCRVGQEP